MASRATFTQTMAHWRCTRWDRTLSRATSRSPSWNSEVMNADRTGLRSRRRTCSFLRQFSRGQRMARESGSPLLEDDPLATQYCLPSANLRPITRPYSEVVRQAVCPLPKLAVNLKDGVFFMIQEGKVFTVRELT